MQVILVFSLFSSDLLQALSNAMASQAFTVCLLKSIIPNVLTQSKINRDIFDGLERFYFWVNYVKDIN